MLQLLVPFTIITNITYNHHLRSNMFVHSTGYNKSQSASLQTRLRSMIHVDSLFLSQENMGQLCGKHLRDLGKNEAKLLPQGHNKH
jgi:hypothetical protein